MGQRRRPFHGGQSVGGQGRGLGHGREHRPGRNTGARGGGDELGRAGLAGKVDRHFFEQFSGAILLTVLNAAAYAAAAGNSSTAVVVNSGSTTGGLGAAGSALTPTAIPPTIKVAQGTPIRIFVQRDLDFTGGVGR